MSRRVYIVTGSKGGCGATTLAFELIKRAGSAPARSVLVDGDLSGRRSHAVTFNVVRQLNENRTPGSPALTAAAGCEILELVGSYEDGFAVKSDAVENFVAKLSPEATVVADLPQPFASAVRPFAARALRFIVVVEPTLLGVSAARQLLTDMTRFGVPSGRIALVLNSRDGAAELKRADIAATLQIPVAAELPQRKDRNYARAIDTLAETLFRLPNLDPLSELRPSASLPTGDRRDCKRNGAHRPAQADPVNGHGHDPHPVVARVAAEPAAMSSRDRIKNEINEALMSRVDFGAAARMNTDSAKMAELRSQVNSIVGELLAARSDVGSVEEGALIKQEIIQEALGLGAIESLVHDPSITEIMVNGAREIYVERFGKISLVPNRFVDERQVRIVIERVLAPLGRRIDESSPMVDARLPDGSRVNATIPPMSIDGPTLTIRRFGSRRLSFADLQTGDSITGGIVDFLRACVEARLNIVVSGGTGSGKTTLLNAMSAFIPRDERIITIEDAAELKLDQPHVIRLEARPPNLEGLGEIRIRDCVRNALRMRPDRIIVGECRGAEALDMLQAMNTGHSGSITTVHANSPRDALSRIETMVVMSGLDLPIRAIRDQVAAAIDIVIQVSRFSDGSRKITNVSEVTGMERDIVSMQDIVSYRQRGVDKNQAVIGSFISTGVQPNCLKQFGERGIPFDPTVFGPVPAAGVAAWSAR
jgi:Flp pilus assembly CpaF family ATPase/MinD-like ATPase involved in chromosome partitioning or flagellar assembly